MKKIILISITLLSLVLTFFLVNRFGSPVIHADSPPPTIELTLPDFTVKTLEGKDTVTIPEGILLSVVGKPYVPFFQKRFTYSANFSIQNVTLVDRSQIKEGKGLNIPNFKFEIDQEGKVPKVPEQEQKDWFPEKDFEWEIDEKPDGSKMLLVTIYPFYYNAKTTEYKYVQHYKFTVEFIPTLLQIKEFKPDKDVFELGQPATFTASLYYQDNKSTNLIASLMISDLEKKEVDQAMMIDLSELEGENTNLAIEWKNDKKLAGTYYGRLEIRDFEGRLIDFKQTSFRIGRSKLNLTEFTATKGKVDPGDVVGLSIKVQNSAKTPVDGKLLIKISEPGKEIKRFEKEFKGLKAGETLAIQESWKTLELKKGFIYILTGIAYYESETTTPIILTLSTNVPPIAKFLTAPALLETGKEITFDASGSLDSDGEITGYRWDFGDNLIGSGKAVTHLYNVAGTYPIKLTLTDNAGENTVLTVDIKVVTKSGEIVPDKIIIKLYIGQKTYTVNDIKKEMDTEPIIFQGRTLLPIRYVAEALGATVGWVQAEQKATIVLKETNIELWIGKNSAKVNGEYKLIDASNPEVKPIVVPPGRTMLPIRFVAETLGCQVDWNQVTKEVKITYPK
jgi:PKD repeat protein